MLNRDSFFSSLSNAAQWEPGCTFNRKNPIPLDSTSVFKSYADLSAYINKKTDNTAYPGQIVAVINELQSDVYVIEPSGTPTKLAAGGDTSDLLTKLNAESDARAAADTSLSEAIDAVSGDLASAKTSLKVTVKEATTTTDGMLKTYMVKQGDEQCGQIDIPKDFLVKSAQVKTCETVDNPESGYKVGDKYFDFVINSKDSEDDADGQHLYVKLTDLVDTYTGKDGTTVEVTVGEDNAIGAEVKDGAITAAKLAKDVSDEISKATAGVAANAKAIESAKTDLKAYADTAEADALSAAKADTTAKISGLTASIDAGKDSDNKQKFFTHITQTAGVVDATANVIQLKDVNGLDTRLDDIAGSVETTVQTSIDALAVSDIATDKMFVTSVSQTAGKISVSRAYIKLDDLSGDIKTQLKDKLNGVYDEAGAAKTAKDEAIAAADTALTTAKAELTGLVSTTSAATLADAKAYANDLSDEIFGKFNDIETSTSNLANKVASVESDITAISNNVSTNTNSIDDLKTTVSTITADINGLSNKVSAEVKRASDAEKTLTDNVSSLSSEFKTISGDHETRLTDVESTVGKLSSAMHFRGVIDNVQEGTEISAALLTAFDDLQDGDIAIHLESGTEYIYSNSAWYQLGDETNHASKSALAAEEQARASADSELCNLINKKVYVDGHEVSSLSVKNISRDDYHDLVVNETVDPNTIYVVSSETLNMYGEKIENVLSGKNDTDAATVGQVNAAKDEAIAAAKANSISAIELNSVPATLSNNKFTFDITCINCGDANS